MGRGAWVVGLELLLYTIAPNSVDFETCVTRRGR